MDFQIEREDFLGLTGYKYCTEKVEFSVGIKTLNFSISDMIWIGIDELSQGWEFDILQYNKVIPLTYTLMVNIPRLFLLHWMHVFGMQLCFVGGSSLIDL